MKKLILLFAVSLVVILMPVKFVFADNNAAADFLCEIAIRQYERGDIEDAIHEFSKALMLDPNHEVSKTYLAKMGLSDGIYNKGRQPGSDIADLAQHIVSYQSQVGQLEGENGELHQDLNNLRRDHEKFVSSTDQIRETRRIKDLEIATLQARIKDQEVKIQETMAKLGTEFDVRKQYLEDQVAKQKQDLLRQQEELNQKIAAFPAIAPVAEEPPARTKEIVMFRNVDSALGYEEQVAALSENYNKAREEYSVEKAKNDHIIQVLEDYVYTRRGEIDQLENKLLHKDVDFVNQEDVLLARLDELVRVYRMLENQARLMKGIEPVLE